MNLQISWNIINVVTCEPLNLASGQIFYNTSALANGGYPVNTVVSFTCINTYNLIGSETRSCLADGTCSQATPVCAPAIGNEMNNFNFINVIQLTQSLWLIRSLYIFICVVINKRHFALHYLKLGCLYS